MWYARKMKHIYAVTYSQKGYVHCIAFHCIFTCTKMKRQFYTDHTPRNPLRVNYNMLPICAKCAFNFTAENVCSTKYFLSNVHTYINTYTLFHTPDMVLDAYEKAWKNYWHDRQELFWLRHVVSPKRQVQYIWWGETTRLSSWYVSYVKSSWHNVWL